MTQATVATPPVTEDVPVIKIGNATFRLIFHDLYRPLTEGEYAGLKDSIERHGIRQDITVVSHGNLVFDVIDGAHRLKAAAELGYKLERIPKKETIGTPDELRDLAETLNEDRRQLTVEERRERALKLRQQGQSYRQIGEALGVDPMTARKDVQKATVDTSTVAVPATVTGKDGKKRRAAEPEPTEREIEIVRDLIAEAFTAWTRPVYAKELYNKVQRLEGGAGTTHRAVNAALDRMVEAGNVMRVLDAKDHKMYALTHDPAIDATVQGGEAAQGVEDDAPEEQPEGDVTPNIPPAIVLAPDDAPMTTEDVKRAILAALSEVDGPCDLVAMRDAGQLAPSIHPARFWDIMTEMQNAGTIRRVTDRTYESARDAWLDEPKTQTAKDADLIYSHLPEGHGRHLSSLRAATGLDKERFTKGLNLLVAAGKVVQQPAKNPAESAVIRAELVKPAPATETPKTEEAPATSSADDQRLIVLLRTFITEADALRHALMSERAAGKKAALDSELYDGASEAHEIISGFTSLISKKYQSGLLDLLEDYLGWTKEQAAQEQGK